MKAGPDFVQDPNGDMLVASEGGWLHAGP
jgi:hypothetical protein